MSKFVSLNKIISVGLTRKKLIVKKLFDDAAFAEVEFLVDSGAIYSLVPSEILKKIKIKSHRTVEFAMADGTKILRKIGDAHFEYNGIGGAAPVIFGEKGDEPLLGATTLEALGLMLNPFTRELHPMKMLLV